MAKALSLTIAPILLFAAAATPIAAQAQESDTEKKADAGEQKWDVNRPPGASVTVEIDTEEGTWLNVDISPDGSELVFDLLGDLYVSDFDGNTRKLTSGISWDMQPRFSPNGRWIAFTSDRGGGDNIWIIDRDGTDPRAVTEEGFRLLNSPCWSPDSEFIAARKHFTSRRSLGAGEIWLYHRSGGDGVQLVARPNDQKDLGEPAFSPDGRYVYFSQDATPGPVFEYNKDSNGQIYVIKRLDRETGEIEQVINGAGGAVRPTPSPDGKTIAFVRRVRFRSVLYLHDIASGQQRRLYDGLDRDMQETWAIHGVYPVMCWTPDSRSLVFWAGGRIRKLDVASLALSTIPFRVKDTREIREALRFHVDASPPEFDVRMLRWANVAPGGDRVVYQALGHLYYRELPDGTPRRLTEQSTEFEYFPSYSRAGDAVVYSSWSDTDLGAVRIASATGGDTEGRKITTQAGHYVEPVLSPDAKNVVYRKVRGGRLRSPLWSEDPGLYVVSSEGGEGTRISKSGRNPHFGSESDRLYFVDSENGKRALVSTDLHGHERRVHLLSENATEFRVSPDGRWVAFCERFHVFVLPFVATGTPLDVGPKTRALPLRKVSSEAGEYIHWSGDSAALHWTLGPELFTLPLEHAFAFLDGAPDPLPDPPAHGVSIGFRAPTDVPTGRVAIVGARIVTMRRDEVIEDGAIVVEGNRIKAVGRRADVEVPKDAHLVNGEGMTVLPGLVDVHAHGPRGTNEIVPQQNWGALSELSFGVTTIHDPSSDTSTFFAASEMARAGAITSPRLFSTGTILYGAAGDFKAEIESLDDARFHLRRMQAVGAFSVKSYNQPRRDQRQQVITAARELGMMVVPEGGSLFEHNMTMVVDGHTGIEHCLPVAEIYDDVIQLWSQSDTGYTPTLVVAYGGLSGEYYWYQHTDVWRNKRLMSFVPRFLVDPRARRRPLAPEEEYNHFNAARICKKLHDAGVSVQLGAHGQREGLAAHWELWMFVQGGMTPHEALQAGTINGARYIGLEADIGSLEEGKLADLIVLERNPLENIRDSEHVRFTMVNGRLYDSRTLDQVGNHPAKRPPLFWEEVEGNGPRVRLQSCSCGHGTQRP